MARSPPAPKRPLKPVVAELYRLAPLDGVLEFRVVMAVALIYAPRIPRGNMPLLAEPMSWRRWLWSQAHLEFLSPHRTANETCQVLRRMGYWEPMATDSDSWYAQCAVCLQRRGRQAQPPARSMLADDGLTEVLPWLGVIIDAQGPFTRADGGRAVRP